MNARALFDFTKTLVNIPSVAPEEGEIAGFLSSFLRNLHYDVREQDVSGSRKNIFAVAGDRPKVILCTHMDTAPEYFSADEDENNIYGRGACDAKSSIAAMTWAAQETRNSGLDEIALLFLVGEEVDSIGAKRANELKAGSEFIIVGEPTENRLGAAHKGLLSLRMKTKGKAVHSAYPDQGESAIDKMITILDRIRNAELGEDPIFGKSHLNLGTIRGGSAFNVVAGQAVAEMSIRTVKPSSQVLERIEDCVAQEAEIEVITRSEPQKLFTLPGYEQVVLPFGTDIPHLKNFGRPLLLGPGSGRDAHGDGEKVKKEQLTEAVGIYLELVKTLIERLERAPLS